MRAKRLETLLGSGLGIEEAEMVHRFQNLRGHKLLPVSRGRNAEDIGTNEIVSGLLSIVDQRPGFAGLTTQSLRNLRPVGTLSSAFAKAPTFGAAMRGALENEDLLNTITEIRITNSEIYRNSFGRGTIHYLDMGRDRVTYYVGATAVSLLQPGAEIDYDPRDLISSMIRETIVFPDILKKIMREAKNNDVSNHALAS